MSPEKVSSSEDVARNIRLDILDCVKSTGRRGAHVAPSLSCTDILAVVFNDCFNPDTDVFVLSKGHAGLAYYAAMAETGLITKAQLETFDVDGGAFPGQPSRSSENSIAYSSGSLGMGLSYAAGRALAKKESGEEGRVFVLLGDGELNEGSVWESAGFAAQMNLDNLVAVVDANGMQSDGASADIINLDIPSIWKAFAWSTVECDGHDCDAIERALASDSAGKPLAIVAHTVKGKGVSYMENSASWHHAALSDEQYAAAVEEVRNGL